MSDCIDRGTLDRLFDEVRPFRRPPVQTWHPERMVDLDLEIRADGSWIHEGGVIGRHELVKLFSTVLARRDGDFFLITPTVGYRIRVEDTPFQVVEVSVEGGHDGRRIWFRTNMDETVPLDRDHPLDPRIDPKTGEPDPVVLIRDGLKARLKRSAYYHLAELAERELPGSEVYGVRSGGVFFPLM